MFEDTYDCVVDSYGSMIYFNILQYELPGKMKTHRLCQIIEQETKESFIDSKLYLDIQINRDKKTEDLIKASPEEQELYDMSCQKIFENYKPYTHSIDVRYNGVLQSTLRKQNLIKYIQYCTDIYGKRNKLYTGDNDADGKECYSCLCSQNDCMTLNLIQHIKTKKVFCIGDKCIKKFNRELYKNIQTHTRNSNNCNNKPCTNCGCILISVPIDDEIQNFDPGITSSTDGSFLCIHCWVDKNLTKNVKRHYGDLLISKDSILKTTHEYIKHKIKCNKDYCRVPLHFRKSGKYKKNAPEHLTIKCCNDCHNNDNLLLSGILKRCNTLGCYELLRKSDKEDICHECLKKIKEKEDYMKKMGKWKDCIDITCQKINKFKISKYCKDCRDNIITSKWKICCECENIVRNNLDNHCEGCIMKHSKNK